MVSDWNEIVTYYIRQGAPGDQSALISLLKEVQEIFKKQSLIACTACKYCISECPSGIPIPEIFACMNKKKMHEGWNSSWYFEILTKETGKPSDCISCGACERICPQKLEIRNLLKLSEKELG